MSVTSGVPQGSVLGPLLYVNNITDGFQSTLEMFADDSRTIKTPQDVFKCYSKTSIIFQIGLDFGY